MGSGLICILVTEAAESTETPVLVGLDGSEWTSEGDYNSYGYGLSSCHQQTPLPIE